MKKGFFTLVIMLLWSIYPYSIHATTSHLTSRDEVFAFVEEAFRAQVSLSMEAREMEEIEEILAPYFSIEMIYLFLDENLTGDQGEFFTHGNEFGKFYLPFYQLSDQTVIEMEENSILLYEYYEPIIIGEKRYEGSYEGVLLRRLNEKWLVTNMLEDKEVRSIINTKEKNYSTLVYMPLLSIENQVTYITDNRKKHNNFTSDHL